MYKGVAVINKNYQRRTILMTQMMNGDFEIKMTKEYSMRKE